MDAASILTDAGIELSHWGLRIQLAEERGYFTQQDRRDAGEWPTCACGKQDPRIPRFSNQRPRDYGLESLGLSFYNRVRDHDAVGAADVLVEIEERSREILHNVIRNEESAAMPA